jgi:hypothetical protein
MMRMLQSQVQTIYVCLMRGIQENSSSLKDTWPGNSFVSNRIVESRIKAFRPQ